MHLNKVVKYIVVLVLLISFSCNNSKDPIKIEKEFVYCIDTLLLRVLANNSAACSAFRPAKVMVNSNIPNLKIG